MRILSLLTLSTTLVAGEAIPLGHPDFYPSPDRSVGLRGDGNGYFPGATFPGEFWEGTPVQVDRSMGKDRDGKEKTAKAWDFTDTKSKNIVWKTKLPSWANSQPIVVGDRVFMTGEPDLLMCCDAKTGKVLWSERQNAWEIAGVAPEAAKKAQRLFDIALEAVPRFGGMIGSGTMTRLLSPEEFQVIVDAFTKDLPKVIAALNAVDPQTKWDEIAAKETAGLKEYVRLLTEGQASGKVGKTGKGLDHDVPADIHILGKTIQQRISAIAPIAGTSKNNPGPLTDSPWGNLVGFAVPVPVSDGLNVYASFAQGQTVCYSLDGKRQWAVYREQEREGSRMSHAQSMRLAGNVLVDMHGGTKTVTGLDTKTGKVVWEAPTLGDFAFGKAGGYYVASHALMPLKDGAKIEHVLVTSRGNIIRVRDGKVLGPLPFTHGSSGGPSLSFSGDIVYRVICGDNSKTPLAAFRLSLAGDTIKTEKLWETPGSLDNFYYQGRVALPGHYYLPNRDGIVFDAVTGTVSGKGLWIGGLSNFVVGSTWIWLNSNSNSDPLASNWGGRRWDGKALAIFRAADISTPTAPKPLETTMVIGDSEFPNVPTMQELTPGLYALPNYCYNSWGKPAFSVHTDSCMYPQGDRLFIRTLSSLYCIGDPAKPWHTPESAPAAARTGK